MGGHGALISALKIRENTGPFPPSRRSPPRCAVRGAKAFTGYFGSDQTLWRTHDASELVRRTALPYPILIDQGIGRQVPGRATLSGCLRRSLSRVGQALTLRRHPDYDHGYYFIQSFMAEHLHHHAAALNR